MKTYDVRCPLCGTVNYNLYLEETHGWMECDHCHRVVHIPANAKAQRTPGHTGANRVENRSTIR